MASDFNAQPARRIKSLCAIQWRMDAKTTRRDNLRTLERRYGSLAELERRTEGEVAANYLSQVKNEYRAMGDRVARKVEEKLGLARGWMDQHHTDVNVSEPLAMERARHEARRQGGARTTLALVADSEEATDVCAVPRLDIRASMGTGAPRPGHDAIVGRMQISREWIRRNLPDITSPENIHLITGYGDSMESTFYEGDILFVDIGVREVRGDAVYVFTMDDELYIKTLQRWPDNAIKVISDNRAKYDAYIIDEKSRVRMEILGRVVWAWNGNKL